MTRARNFADVISGNFAIPSGSLGNAVPADGSITTAKLADDAITSAKIANDAVTSAKLDTNIDIAGTLDSTGAITADAGLTLPSGQGINFSATADTSATGATTASELLDDYEEGTWTPTVGQGTVTTEHCTYTKIGNTVYVRARILDFSNRTSSGGVTVSGLPFASSSDNRASQGILARYVNSGGDAIVAYIGPSSSDLLLFTTNQNDGYTTVTHNTLTSTSSLFFVTIAYKAA